MKMSIRKTCQGFIFHKMTYLLPFISFISILASNTIATSAIAQSNNKASANPQVTNNSQSASPVILYVNPLIGSDRPENGTNTAPFKTISYAVSRIQDGSPRIIQLANGTYSTATGEQFPIKLRSNVTLRGNETNKGKGIAILGGGAFLTASKFPQNVAIALADRSELRGVSVTNPNPRGYGLWIENVSPAIANNTFLDNQHDGILVTGKSTAIISANQFFRNGTSGLAIEGEASPDIRGNLFQQTTFGMSIRQDAAPQITENTFTQNQNGILIQANAKPVLRGNAIVNNRAYGLTISDMARPDLGKPNEDGGNVFQGNGTLDLQNVSRNAVAVIGNQLDSKRVKGNLQLSNVRQPANLFAVTNANSIKSNPSRNNNAASSVASTALTNPVTSPVTSPITKPVTTPVTSPIKSDRFANINQQLEQRIATNQPMNLAPNLDAPPALVRNATPNQSSNLSGFNSQNSSNQANNPFWYESVTPLIIRITPKRIESPVPPNTEITSSLRPVVSVPPSGEPVNQPIQIAPLGNTSFKPQVQPRYRVVVPVSSPNAVAQVRQIVPNSFASRLNGYLVVQIGAYSDRRIAEAQVSRLAQKGLSARIESINP